jgi:hypothetical protein
MEELLKVLTDNGVAIFCVVMFVYYIFTDKKESNELFKNQNDTLKEISNTQVKMLTSLEQLNMRVEKLEKSNK